MPSSSGGWVASLLLPCNRNVEIIDKSRSNLDEIPSDIFRYAKSLQELSLDYNNLVSIPKDFWKLTRLRRLNLSDNGIRSIPDHIANFTLLTELDISRNDITELPDAIRYCIHLSFLDISANPLNRLPPNFWQLTSLRKLLMNDITLIDFPDQISNLTQLEVLEAHENLLKTLPTAIGSLAKLTSLDLASNEIYELPYEIGELSNLKDLFLDDNDLVEIPKTIGDLRSLQCLDIGSNELEYIPDQLGRLTNLTDLSLGDNELEYLPDTIGNLKELTTLKVPRNQLLSLPSSICQCTNLTELILTENALTEMPSSIGHLVNLRTANFDKNRIQALPESIGKCTKLGVLSLRDNKIRVIPASIERLVNLSVLDLTNNRLEWLPVNIAKLNNLKALWLSETQGSLSLPTLNIEMRGTKQVMTCMLLPQQPGSLENLLQGSIDSLHHDAYYERHFHGHYIPPPLDGEADSGSEQHLHDDTTAKQVAFQVEVDEDGNPLGEEGASQPLQRHGTPHPRDLRGRHAGLLQRSDSKRRQETEISAPATAATPDSPAHSPSAHTSITQHQAEVEPDRERSPSPPPPPVRTSGSVRFSAAQPNVESDDEEIRGLGDASDIDRSSLQEDSSGDESGDRRVGFQHDVADVSRGKADLDPNALVRRDTPHHKKGKRLVLNSDSEQIVDRILNQNSRSPSTDDANSPQHSSDVRADSYEDHQLVCVLTRGSGCGFGMTIAGGVGSVSYREGDEGIFLSTVIVNGPAFHAGLKVGDKIVSVDGVQFEGIDHKSAVELLQSASFTITVTVLRRMPKLPNQDYVQNGQTAAADDQVFAEDPFTESQTLQLQKFFTLTIVLKRQSHQSFGFSFNPVNEKGLKVTRIAQGGVAALEGTLQIDDVIQTINGVDVKLGADSTRQVVELLKSQCEVHLLVLRPAHLSQIDVSAAPPPPPPVAELQPVPAAAINGDGSLDHVEEVTLVKSGEPLGFSIKGGIDYPTVISGKPNPSVYISKINSTGLAARSSLVVGDKILSVNGQDMSNVTHEMAVSALISPNHTQLVMLVAHESFLAGYREVHLTKSENEVWGLGIEGGIGFVSANPYDPQDECIYVTHVLPYSPADLASVFVSGQRILEMNNKSMVGVTYPEAKHELNSSHTNLKITVCDGFNAHLQPSPARTAGNPAHLQYLPPSVDNHISTSHLPPGKAQNPDSDMEPYGDAGGAGGVIRIDPKQFHSRNSHFSR